MAEVIRFKRLSISMSGSTLTICQDAKNLSEALEQELSYYINANKIPVQINFTEDD